MTKRKIVLKNNTLLGATWCGPCKRVKNFLDIRGVEYTYIDIDTDEGLELAREWSIRSVPAMVLDGKIRTGDTQIMGEFREQK